MKQTGRYSSYIESEEDFDIDHKINEEIDKTKRNIKDLKEELSPKHFKMIIKAITTELIEVL
jgi:hypothetical protein